MAPARDLETTFSAWAEPPGAAEQERCERVIAAVRKAVAGSAALSARTTLVFPQGSFRNRVNVRAESDVDVGVMLHGIFLDKYPDGKTREDFGNVAANYSYRQFKDELELALVAYFGRGSVTRGSKAFDIKAPGARVEADVVPVFEFRQYWAPGSYRAGVALIPDNSSLRIENYPERLLSHWPNIPQHYENGVSKNEATRRRFKSVVRILKKIRIELEDIGNPYAGAVPGYLLECLVWNCPDGCFEVDTWEGRVALALAFLWHQTRSPALCDTWLEVDGIKYLFRPTQPWTMSQAHSFVHAACQYLGVGTP